MCATDGCSRVTISRRRAVLSALVLALLIPGAAASQEEEDPPAAGSRIARSVPPQGARTHLVVPGARFGASPFDRWFYGDNYRDLWTTAIEIPVLDLDSVGGGLTPLRTGGMGQSISLHFTGEDDVRYTVRSLDKDPTRRLADEIKNSVVSNVIHDMISALLPTGALIVDPLMEATGILHSKHSLVVIPDDPRLGEYRERYAGLIGSLQVHPSEGPDDTPGFSGSRRVSGSEALLDALEESACEQVDARGFLKARLMDFFVGDKDRHPGQWRWARFPDGECYIWLPVPEDRDQAFIHYGGVAMMLIRGVFPRVIQFKDTYPSLEGLTTSGWELDRELLAELDKAAWDEVVKEFRAELTDPVIEDAVRRLPAPYYAFVGQYIEETLKGRRDALPDYVTRYYELITREVEIQATDEDEYARLEHLANGDLAVSISVAGESGHEVEPPYFERTFRSAETDEIRLYLRGGSDRAEVLGAEGRITVRIDGGGGSDSFTNASGASASKTRFYDARGDNVFVEGGGARIDERRYERPPATAQPWRPENATTTSRNALDWGREAGTYPIIWADSDLGALVRLRHHRTRFGFRKDPFASRHSFSIGVATRGMKPFASYVGVFRHVWSGVDVRLALEYSGFDLVRFRGFGNDIGLENPSAFYEIEQSNFVFAPAFEFQRIVQDVDESGEEPRPLRSEVSVNLGPVVKWSDTPLDANRDNYIGSLDRPLYGTGSFGQVGAQGEMAYDIRDNAVYPTRGAFARVTAVGYPAVWDVESAFGSVDAEARTYLTARMPTRPTLALRVGGKKLWGDFPFHESAFLGGPGRFGISRGEGPVRGLHKNRFAGEASLYANAELRLALASIDVVVPGEFGVFGAADVGRVYYSGDPSDADDWHNGTGGGFFMSLLRHRTTLSIAAMKGRDGTSFYFRAGPMF